MKLVLLYTIKTVVYRQTVDKTQRPARISNDGSNIPRARVKSKEPRVSFFLFIRLGEVYSLVHSSGVMVGFLLLSITIRLLYLLKSMKANIKTGKIITSLLALEKAFIKKFSKLESDLDVLIERLKAVEKVERDLA